MNSKGEERPNNRSFLIVVLTVWHYCACPRAARIMLMVLYEIRLMARNRVLLIPNIESPESSFQHICN